MINALWCSRIVALTPDAVWCYTQDTFFLGGGGADILPLIKRTKITRKQKWEEKQMYGNFKRQTSEISVEKTCSVAIFQETDLG